MRPTLIALALVTPLAAIVPLAAQGGSAMELTSPAFAPKAEIPTLHTCEGADRAPALTFANVPAAAKSLALIVDDPDAPDPKAPKTTWVHWVAYNLPASAKGLPEGGKLPAGSLEGVNDWKHAGWNGPCPPIGRHRYVFKLYALDQALPDLKKPTKAQLEKAMEGHVLAKAELVGTYQKKNRG
jgi:Raf kinase inhibitor-like YbhB/YbcL family protein